MRRFSLWRSYNYRAILVRFVLNVLVLLFTVWIVPHIAFTGGQRVVTVLVIAAAFGLLNAFVKPLIQLILLPFLFVSYGVVVVLINTLMLFLLSLIFQRFVVDRLFWAIVGGVLVGLLGNILESLAGLRPPILAEHQPQTQVSEQPQQELEPVAVGGTANETAPQSGGEA